jgi:hypothetical protein
MGTFKSTVSSQNNPLSPQSTRSSTAACEYICLTKCSVMILVRFNFPLPRCCVLVGQMKSALLEIKGIHPSTSRNYSDVAVVSLKKFVAHTQINITLIESSWRHRERLHFNSCFLIGLIPVNSHFAQRICFPGYSRIPDPGTGEGNKCPTQAGCHRHCHRCRELHWIRRHEPNSKNASKLY